MIIVPDVIRAEPHQSNHIISSSVSALEDDRQSRTGTPDFQQDIVGAIRRCIAADDHYIAGCVPHEKKQLRNRSNLYGVKVTAGVRERQHSASALTCNHAKHRHSVLVSLRQNLNRGVEKLTETE